MPPKQRGHNTAGRDKLFRNAIEHVHVGVGYAVLGNISLTLAAGGVQTSDDSPNSAFFLELNELLLSNTSSDFKKFRFEVLPLCESRQLVLHHQKTIAHKLLLAIANKVQNEGFGAFLKLTIAFVRDVQARFLVFFEAFHQVVNLGIYDASNHLIPEVERVQLVFATQVAWFRELGATLVAPEHREQVTCSVLPACLRQLNDTKDYIRRLAGETLAACCRQQRALIPVVFELAAQHITKGTAAERQQGNAAVADGEDEAPLSDDSDDDAADAVHDGTADSKADITAVDVLDVEDLHQDSVVDGMTYFTTDLLRGLRGSLHTNFEDVVVLVMVALDMLPSDVATTLPNGQPLQSIMATWMHLSTPSTAEEKQQLQMGLHRMAQVVLPQAMRTLVVETRKQAADGGPTTTTGSNHQHPIFRMLSSMGSLLGCTVNHALHLSAAACWSLLLDMLRETLHSANGFAMQSIHPIRAPMESIVQTLVSTLPSSGAGATPCGACPLDATVVLSKLLRLVVPLMLTSAVGDAATRRWLTSSVVRPLVDALVGMMAVGEAIHADEHGSLKAQMVAAFFQDLVQKNRACCLSEERRGSDDSSSEDDEGSGEDDTPRPKKKLPQRDAAAFDCFLEPQTAGVLLAQACEWTMARRRWDPAAVDAALLMLLLASEKTAHASQSPLEIMFAAPNTTVGASAAVFLLEVLRTHSPTAEAVESATRLHVVMSLMPVVLHDNHCFTNQSVPQQCIEVLEQQLIGPCLNQKAVHTAAAAELLPVASHACNVLAALAAQAMDQGPAVPGATAKPPAKGKKSKQKPVVAQPHQMSSASGITWSLEALIAAVAHASQAQTSAAVAANQGLTRAIGYLLGAFGALVGRVSRRTPASSAALLSSRIVHILSPAGQDALHVVLIKATASSSQPLRIQALRLLKALCLEDNSIDESKTRVQGCKPLPASFFDALIGAETSDPLANGGNIDDAKIHLTKVSFDANVGRVQDALQASILLHSSFGLLHVKFAGVWPIALKMIADLLRHEASASASAKQASSSSGGDAKAKAPQPLWSAVLYEAHDIVFASAGGAGAGRQKRGKGAGASLAVSASKAKGYPLVFSDQQHHEEGSLVSKAFAGAKVQDHVAVMQCLGSGQLCDLNVVAGALTSSPWSTDALTVAKTFLSGFEEILKHTSSPFDEKVQLVERLFVELASIDQGTHATLSDLKGLEDRLLLLMHALNSAPTSVISANSAKHNTAWRNASTEEQDRLAHRNDTLVRILNAYLPNSNHSLQRAAVENLKRLKIVPFDPYCAQIVPFCGANMKDAFAFLSTMNVEEDISEQHRVDYIASVMVVVLPKLSQRVTKEKMKDQAVLGRRVMGLLQHTGGDAGLKRVLDRTMDHILGSSSERYGVPTGTTTHRDGAPLWDCYDFLGQMHPAATTDGGQQATMQPPVAAKHWVRRFEQRIKQLTTAARVLDQFIASVGMQFAPWAHRCFVIVVQAYLFSCRSMHPGSFALPSSAMTAASTLRKVLAQSVVSLMDQFPHEVMSVVASAGPVHAAKVTRFVKELFANSKTLASFGGVSNQRASQQGAGIHSSFLKMMSVWIQHPDLHPLICHFGDEVLQQLGHALEVSAPGSEAVHKASSDTVYAALSFLTQVLNVANEPLSLVLGSEGVVKGSQEGTTLGTDFVDRRLEAIFETLYKLVVQGSRRDDASLEDGKESAAPARRPGAVGKRVMGFTVRMWGEVIQTVAYLSERLSGTTASNGEAEASGSAHLSTMLGQLLEIALKFVSNPLCCTDAQAVTTAATVVETLVQKVASIHPSQHYRRMVMLFNMVTNPYARTTLCRAFQTATAKYPVAQASSGALAQYDAVARVLFGLNSFTADPNENEGDGQQEQPQQPDDSLDRYDFERRYHCFHSLMTFFNHNGNYGALARQRTEPHGEAVGPFEAAANDDETGASRRKDKRTSASVQLPASTVRRERTYEGVQDVRIPLDKTHQPNLSTDALMAIAANLMFFLRDSERTIRSLAAQTLFAMLKYASVNTTAYIEACLNSIVRPIVLASLRQGIVAKDPAIRLCHMESFGGLARYFPANFPSFAALYSPNSERNFFINVGHAQHKCRLSALALLRKQSAGIHVRDHLRVFVPFLLVLLKDFAQGKRNEGSATVTEGRAKGYAESALMTLASLVVHMPWEGYHHVLKLLLQSANENESLRLTMLKGVVHVLQNFHFLDELDRERTEPTMVDPSDSESAGEENTDVSARQRRAMWKSTKIVSTLESEILPQLYRFITSDKKGDAPGRKSEIRVGDLTAEKAISSGQSKLNDNRAITQLPVAVAIAKIVRLFPEASFKQHIEQLLHEIILKLRTKNDKQRESARKVLCSVMREIGPSMLKFVVTKLKDNFVHGYQLHVLGYTVVTVLYSMYAPASPYAMISRKQSKEMAKVSKKAAAAVKHRGGESDDDGAHSDGDDDALLPASLLPAFDEAAGKVALKEATDVLFDIFMDDYLGEIGAQKEQIELMSTMTEVKRSRALQGFIFLATHCDAADAMARFVHKIAWVLAPPTAAELLKKGGVGGIHVVGNNTKYVSGGEKNSIADSKFVNKVRFLGLRVARALMTNRSLDVSSSLDTVRDLIQRHNAVREEKIARFEAKDGTRRIRGNWASQIAVQRKTTKERYEENFTVAQRPERIDVDVNASTVLVGSATQQKQKLRVYRGRYAKDLSEAGRGFAAEDSDAAVVLDTLDEFCLKFLLSVLKRVLGIGKETKLGKMPLPAAEDSAAANDERKKEDVDEEEEDEEDEEDQEGLVTDEQVEGELDHEDNEALEAAGDAEQLDDLGALCEAQRQEEEQNQSTRRHKKTAVSFTSAYKPLLETTVPVILAALQGEGSDTVVSHALDVLHALLALRPPLDAINTLGKTIFDTIVQFFVRGGVIKQRALRVVAAVVQHKRYQLHDDDASRLVSLVRTELIDTTEFVPNALLVLHAVLSKRAMVTEVYDIISVVTETMMHWSHAPVIRMRCVSVLVKFLTEYKLTREKLRSHVDLYVRNLPYANGTSQLALLELLDLLISRFPTEILREEAQVIFVPLVGLLCRGENRDSKEKAATVIGHLVVHAGIASVEPILGQWLNGKSISVRTSAYQALAVCIPCLTAYFDKDELLAMFRFATSAIVGGCMTHETEALTKKEREAKRQRDEEDVDETALAKRNTQSKKAKVQADTKVWQPVFFALRCLEALVDVHPTAAFAMHGGALVQHIFLELLEHAHPWVKAAAMRVAMKYLYQCIEPQSGYLACVAPGTLSTTAPISVAQEETLPLVCHIQPTAVARSTCIDAEQQLARCSKYLKRVLATVPAHDVPNEKYEANRAIEEPLRANTVKVVLYLVKVVVQLTLALLGSREHHAEHLLSHYASIWNQVVALAKPALEHRRIDGYVVRVATLTQMVGGLIALLPTQSAALKDDDSALSAACGRNALLLVAQVTPAMMYQTVVPLIASSMESTFDKLSAIGSKVCDAVRNELQRRSSDFRSTPLLRTESLDASHGKPTKKKARSERDSAHQATERIAVEDVVVQLTKVADEIRSHARDTETKKQARRAVKRSRTVETPRGQR